MNDPKNTSSCSFIDTNIWLYAFIQSQNEHKRIIARQILQENEVILSTQVINEVCVNLLKKANFSEQDIQALVTSFYQRYFIIDFSRDFLLTASKLRQQYSLSFWDGLIVSAALSANCPILYSEDMQNGLIIESQLTIRNPFLLEETR